jgi:hypothetical protein
MRIAKFGRLFGTKTNRHGQDEEVDFTERAPRFLFRPCSLDDDVTVRDVFLLLKRHKDILGCLNTDINAIVKEGLKLRKQKEFPFTLALISWRLNYSEGSLSGNTIPVLFLVDQSNANKYAPEVFRANEIAGLPLRLSKELMIVDHDSSEKLLFVSPEYAFGQIVWSIIEGLSYFGTPGQREMSVRDMSDGEKVEVSRIDQ